MSGHTDVPLYCSMGILLFRSERTGVRAYERAGPGERVYGCTGVPLHGYTVIQIQRYGCAVK
eukprot:1935814-Pyramimonas_sp.AAC.1